MYVKWANTQDDFITPHYIKLIISHYLGYNKSSRLL